MIEMAGYCKIGASQDPAKRVRQLGHLPWKPILLHSFASDDPFRLEAALHRRFRSLRIRGEWFSLGQADIDAICAVVACNAIDDLPPELMPAREEKRLPFRDMPRVTVRPKRPSRNVVGKYMELPPDLARRMEDLAERNGRTFKEEVIHAFQRHLGTPPRVTITIDTPELPPAELQPKPQPPEPKRRGRPRKKEGGA